MESPDDEGMLTRQEAAALLGIGLRSLHYKRKEGKLLEDTVVTFRRKYGGHPLVRYRQSKLEELLDEGWQTE